MQNNYISVALSNDELCRIGIFLKPGCLGMDFSIPATVQFHCAFVRLKGVCLKQLNVSFTQAGFILSCSGEQWSLSCRILSMSYRSPARSSSIFLASMLLHLDCQCFQKARLGVPALCLLLHYGHNSLATFFKKGATRALLPRQTPWAHCESSQGAWHTWAGLASSHQAHELHSLWERSGFSNLGLIRKCSNDLLFLLPVS